MSAFLLLSKKKNWIFWSELHYQLNSENDPNTKLPHVYIVQSNSLFYITQLHLHGFIEFTYTHY